MDLPSLASTHFSNIPLERMGCLLGAAYEPQTQTIICPGGVTGIAVYGPYLDVEAGFYEVEVDISVRGRNNPRVSIELWTGTVAAKRNVVLERSSIRLNAWLKEKTILEIRLHTILTEFTIHKIAARRIDPLKLAEVTPSAADRIGRRHHFQEAIGFTCKDVAPARPVNVVLDEIFADPSFAWIEEGSLPEHEQLLRQYNIDPNVLHYIFARNNTNVLNGSSTSSLTDGYPYNSNNFQLDIMKKGALQLPSPFHGGVMSSDVSFPVAAPGYGIAAVLYEFKAPFHLIVATAFSWSGAISFMWFVDHDILVHDATQENLCEWGPIIPLLRTFARLCEKYRPLAIKYRNSTKSPACYGCCNSNLGHYFWNDVSGVERVVRSGLSPKFIMARSRRLSLEEIFFEDRLDVIARDIADEDDLFKLVLEKDLLLVRPTGNTIDPQLAAKVERAALRSAQSAGKQVESVDDIARDAFVVFYNLRAHNKAWVDQVDGAVDLVTRLRTDLKIENIVLFLDGYGDCADLVNKIELALPQTCHVVDGTKASFAETLTWAFRCDFFVAVVGSGLVILTWLAAKSGVCHGDRRHMAQLDWWGSVRPGAGTLLSPSILDIEDVTNKFYSDYKLSPSIVSSLAVEFLRTQLG